MRTLQYHNFSTKGDSRWAAASRITGYAPILVFVLFLLSIAQVSLGAVWLASLEDVKIPTIIQTLLIPGLSFFNTPTSLHLHLLARRNPPILALIFSSTLALLWLASSMVMLIPCTAAATRSPHGLRNFECPRGTAGVTKNVSKSVWAMMIALGLLMAVLYVVHAGMAWFVRRYLKRKQGGDEIPLEVDPAAAQKARDRWTKLTREGYL